MNDFDVSALSKEELVELLNMLGRNLLSVDGLWFTCVEDKFGLEKAIEIDEKVWDKFGLTEGLRLKKVKNITASSPIATAPVAITKAAMILSRSPLNTTIESLSSGVFFSSAASWDLNSVN